MFDGSRAPPPTRVIVFSIHTHQLFLCASRLHCVRSAGPRDSQPGSIQSVEQRPTNAPRHHTSRYFLSPSPSYAGATEARSQPTGYIALSGRLERRQTGQRPLAQPLAARAKHTLDCMCCLTSSPVVYALVRGALDSNFSGVASAVNRGASSFHLTWKTFT